MMKHLWIILSALSASCAVTYKPHVNLAMKNTTLRWKVKAKQEGENVCAMETVWDSPPVTYDVAWTGGAACVPTSIKLVCCEGFMRVPGERGCPQVIPLESATSTAERLKAGLFVRLLASSGLDDFSESEQDPVTIFAPLDSAMFSLGVHGRQQLEEGARRSSRLESAPPLLLSHVVKGRLRSGEFQNDQLLPSLIGHQFIRINTFPNGLVTANCVPLVTQDGVALGQHIHTIAGILPQIYTFPITDTVLRELQARRFASYLVQSHQDGLLRSKGPYTIFLPTDAAIDALGPHHAHALRYDPEALEALVLNHIVNGVQCSCMLNDASFVTQRKEVTKAQCRRSGVYIQDAKVVVKDKMATNGVIHVIDRVLLPRRAMLVLDLLRSLGQPLTTFASLVERAGLISTFNSPDTFTVFVPTNQALEGFQHMNATDARTFVLNHMLPGRVLTSSLKNREQASTKGTRLPITFRTLRNRLLADASEIINSNAEGLNGVVHVINKVLTPPRKKTILQWLQEEGRYSDFLYALRHLQPSLYSRLDSTPNKESMTVFAVGDSYMTSKYNLYYDNRVLWNHFLDRALVSEEVPVNGRLVTPTLNNGQLLLVRRGNNIFAGSTHILQRDIICSNGIIHITRDVIIDPKSY